MPLEIGEGSVRMFRRAGDLQIGDALVAGHGELLIEAVDHTGGQVRIELHDGSHRAYAADDPVEVWGAGVTAESVMHAISARVKSSGESSTTWVRCEDRGYETRDTDRGVEGVAYTFTDSRVGYSGEQVIDHIDAPETAGDAAVSRGIFWLTDGASW